MGVPVMSILRAVIYISLPMVLYSVAFAQTDQDIEAQKEGLRLIEELELRDRASIDASRYLKIEGGPATFAEVMRDPDNLQLNFRYAQTQVADGKLRNAASTLERMLLLNPNLHKVRLFYAYVSSRLDNMKEAKVQLDLLKKVPLSPTDRAEADALLSRVERREKRTTYTTELGLGFTYQTNANFAPDGEEAELLVPFLGALFPVVAATDPEESDTAVVGIARFNFNHDLGYQDRRALIGGINVVWNEQIDVDTTDYQSFSGNLGGIWHTQRVDNIVANFLAGHFRLERDSFLTYYGGEIDFQREYRDGRLRVNFNPRIIYEDYDNAEGVTRERTGPLYVFELGTSYRLRRNQIIGGSIAYINKKADESFREYDGPALEIHHTWLVDRYTFVRNRFAYAREEYDAFNPRVSFRKRQDDRFRYRVTYSTPLEKLLKLVLPNGFKGIRMDASMQYAKTSSNIRNFEFDNFKAELFFTKRFDF